MGYKLEQCTDEDYDYRKDDDEPARVPVTQQLQNLTDAQLLAGAKALWESETHPLLAAAGHPVDFESQPVSIVNPLKRKARLAFVAMQLAGRSA